MGKTPPRHARSRLPAGNAAALLSPGDFGRTLPASRQKRPSLRDAAVRAAYCAAAKHMISRREIAQEVGVSHSTAEEWLREGQKELDRLRIWDSFKKKEIPQISAEEALSNECGMSVSESKKMLESDKPPFTSIRAEFADEWNRATLKMDKDLIARLRDSDSPIATRSLLETRREEWRKRDGGANISVNVNQQFNQENADAFSQQLNGVVADDKFGGGDEND